MAVSQILITQLHLKFEKVIIFMIGEGKSISGDTIFFWLLNYTVRFYCQLGGISELKTIRKLEIMKRLFFLLFVFYGCSVLSPLQKGKILSLYHLIETGKFEDARDATEKMIADEESSQWVATWYARGYLCQTAYKKGMNNNDPKLYELYPDQLYVAWDSYENARKIDPKDRMARQLTPKYILLANDFQKLGMEKLNEKKFSEALRAFEKVNEIERLPFLNLDQDTILLYNTALAAYESKNWSKAKYYLEKLHKFGFSENATHLLFRTHLALSDSSAAENVLFEGIENYDDHENLVLILIELLTDQSRPEEAIAVLDKAIDENPANAVFYYNKGLVYQMHEKYAEAIRAYKNAVELNPDDLMAYSNIATCYYNIGVTYEENTLRLNSNQEVKQERQKSEKAFRLSLNWLDKTVAKNPEDIWLIERLSRLYNEMGKPDKTRSLIKNIE